jgi:hypothetical protein
MAAVLRQPPAVTPTAKASLCHGAVERESLDRGHLNRALERNLALQDLLNQRLIGLRMKLQQLRQVQLSLSLDSSDAAGNGGPSASVSSRSGTHRIDERDPFAIQAIVPPSRGRRRTPVDDGEEVEEDQDSSQTQPPPVHSTSRADTQESTGILPSLSQRFRLNASTGRTLNEVVLAAVEEVPTQVDDRGEPVLSSTADDPAMWKTVAAVVAMASQTKPRQLDAFSCAQVWHHTLHPNAGRLSASSLSAPLGSSIAERIGPVAPLTHSTWIELQCHFPGASAFDLLTAFRLHQGKCEDGPLSKKDQNGFAAEATFLKLLRHAAGTEQDQSIVLAAFGDFLFRDIERTTPTALPPRGRVWISKLLRKEHIKNDAQLWDSSCDLRLEMGVQLFGKRWEDIAEGLFYTGDSRRQYSEDLPIYLQWKWKDISGRRMTAGVSSSGFAKGKPMRIGPILRPGAVATPRPAQASVPQTENPSRAPSEWATPIPSQPWGEAEDDDAL